MLVVSIETVELTENAILNLCFVNGVCCQNLHNFMASLTFSSAALFSSCRRFTAFSFMDTLNYDSSMSIIKVLQEMMLIFEILFGEWKVSVCDFVHWYPFCNTFDTAVYCMDSVM